MRKLTSDLMSRISDHFTSLIRLLCLLFVSVTIGVLLIFTINKNLLAQQSPPCTCEPDEESEQSFEITPPGSNGWRSEASSRTPQKLQLTAMAGGVGGGGGTPELCDQIFLPGPLDNIWISSATEFEVTNLPFQDMATLSLEYCGGSVDGRNIDVGISSPSGKFTKLQLGDVDKSEPHFVYQYTFTYSDDEEGDYILEIHDVQGTLYQEIVLQKVDYWTDRYAGARFSFYENQTGKPTKRFGLGQSIHVEYSNYSENEKAEIGLYRYNGEYELMSSWIIETDSNGEYSEIISIPTDNAEGNYALVSISLISKDEPFSFLTSPDANNFKDFGDSYAGYMVRQKNAYFYKTFTVTDKAVAAEPEDEESENSASTKPDESNMTVTQMKQNMTAARVQTSFKKEANHFVEDLLGRINEFQLPKLGITEASMLKVLQQPDAGIRLNALIQEVWTDWQDKTSNSGANLMTADPSQWNLSPFRQLVIRMIQGKQATLVDSQQHALHNYFTRSEDSGVWQNNMDGVIGAINRESFQWQP